MNVSNDYIPALKDRHNQSCIGIWLHDNHLQEYEKNKMELYLSRTFQYHKSFTHIVDYAKYIDRQKLVAKIFLIISDCSLYPALVLQTQKHPDLFEKIYVFLPIEVYIPNAASCFITSSRRRLFEKLFTDILNYIVRENPSNNITHETNSQSSLSSTSQVHNLSQFWSAPNRKYKRITYIRHLPNENDRSLYFLTMMKILCETSFRGEELLETWMTLRNRYRNDGVKLNTIDKWSTSYDKNKAVTYYTESACLYYTINEVCGTENIQAIFPFRAYINDLHKRLKELGNPRPSNGNNTSPDPLYRGVRLPESVLQQLIDNKGGLISMNSFISTSADENVAKMFSCVGNTNKGTRPVLFKLCINGQIQQPFARITNESIYPVEEETLFSPGTIWRIQSIELGEGLYKIQLTSCNELNSKLTELSNQYRVDEYPLLSFGHILQELDDDVQADWFYHKLLKEGSINNEIRGKLCYKIGMIRFKRKDYFVALEKFEESAAFLTPSNIESNETGTSRPLYGYDNGSPLIAIHSNRGLLNAQNGRFSAAIVCYNHALSLLNERESPLEQAVVCNNLGLLYYNTGEFFKARSCFEIAVKLIDENHQWRAEFITNFNRAAEHVRNNENTATAQVSTDTPCKKILRRKVW